MWTCPKCASKIDPAFEVCWNCGTSPDGTVDPSFVPADQAGPIEAPPVVPTLDAEAEAAPAAELPEPIEGELVECYSALDLMEAKFLADQLSEAGIPAVSDTHDMHETLGSMNASPRVWVREEDLPKARAWLETYERHKVVEE
jgi:hypothetical protein